MRPKLTFAFLGCFLPFIINIALVGSTTWLVIKDESPLVVVILITMSLCVTLVLIKGVHHYYTELHGNMESGPARRLTARYIIREPEEMVTLTHLHRPLGRSWTVPSRPTSPVPPPSPPPPTPRTRGARYLKQ
ncbi:unnamed protein product [Caenorhabditis nigoni]